MLKNRSRIRKFLRLSNQKKNNSGIINTDGSHLQVGYDKIFNVSPDGIILLDMNGIVTAANPAAYRIGGYSKEDFVGKHFSEIVTVSESDIARSGTLLETIEREGMLKPFEWSYKRKDGTIGYAEIYASLLKEKQEPVGILVIKKDITERKLSERLVEENEIKYRDLYEKAPNGYFSVGVEGLIHRCNISAAEMLGYEKKDLIGKPVLDLYADTPQGRDKALKVFERFVEGEDITNEELEMQKRDGTPIWISLTVNAIKNDDSQVLESRSMIVDITEHKKAEEKIIESEEKFRNLAEHSPNMIFINKNGRIVYSNEKCEEVMGYTKKEFYAPDFNFFTLIAPDSMELVKKNYDKHNQGKNLAPYEYSLITKDGKRIEAIITTTLINYERESAILGVITDITERKKAEEALKEAENTYRDLLDNTNDLIQSVKPDGHFRYVNKAWRNTLGYSEEELSNLTIFDIVHPDYLEHCQSVFQKLMSGKRVHRVEAAFVSKSGKVIFVEGNVNVKLADGKPIYTRGIFRDITKSKNLEEHVYRLSNAISMSPDYIVITDFDAKIIDINDKVLEMYGANSKEELQGRHFLELIDPAERKMVSEDVAEIIKKGSLERREYTMISRQNEKHIIQVSTSLIKDPDGKPMGMVRVGRKLSKS